MISIITIGYFLSVRFRSIGPQTPYMAPGRRDEMLNIEAMNYFSGQMSADAAGITACLYLYSHLSFHTEGADQERFSRLYHSLRDWACEHDEKEAILAAID
ncbi:TPA: antirestriction protein [Enterobacter asburiae]